MTKHVLIDRLADIAPKLSPGAGPKLNRISQHESVVNVRYVTDFPTCNFACEYCIAGHGETSPMKERDWDAKRYLKITENLAKLPFPINVRFGVAGEFFVDKTLVDGARQLSHAPNIHSLNLITNLSFNYRQYKKILKGYRQDNLAIVASFHPTEVKDHQAWFDTAAAIAGDYDFSALLVGYPPLIDKISVYRDELKKRNIETFVQPFIGPYEGKQYPQNYTEAEHALLTDIMYSRHDVEYLLNLKKPGMCNAGFKSLYINPRGIVYPCGMAKYKTPIGDFTKGPELQLNSAPQPCPAQKCNCDTENINTVSFEQFYELDALNQHRYRYRFTDAASQDHRLDEWNIQY